MNPHGTSGWVQDCEIDSLENMYKTLAHNFAGLPHQVHFKDEFGFKGHVTTLTSDTSAKATECAQGSNTCTFNGDFAHHEFSDSTIAGIRRGTT